MDIKLLLIVFGSVFVAELGDKTQLATLLFSADKDVSRWTVFIGASAALILSSAVAVLAGTAVSQYVSEKVLNYVAGSAFVLIGVWTIVRA
jgi:putative Ca2+/H+ antiporter (TMEM165/GDT1 family)